MDALNKIDVFDCLCVGLLYILLSLYMSVTFAVGGSPMPYAPSVGHLFIFQILPACCFVLILP